MLSYYAGYDIILVAGQSNSVGNSITYAGPDVQANDATTGALPRRQQFFFIFPFS